MAKGMARTLILWRSSHLSFTSPLNQKALVTVVRQTPQKDDFPLFFRIVEQAVEVNVIHQRDSDHCCQA